MRQTQTVFGSAHTFLLSFFDTYVKKFQIVISKKISTSTPEKSSNFRIKLFLEKIL